jgi:hypothetical protein
MPFEGLSEPPKGGESERLRSSAERVPLKGMCHVIGKLFMVYYSQINASDSSGYTAF